MPTSARPPPPAPFSLTNILGKPPGEPRLEDEFAVDRQIGKGAFGVVRLVRRARAALRCVCGGRG
jgi:hypothetical protein